MMQRERGARTGLLRCAGEERVKCAIEPGKYADMTVLSDDVFTIPKQKLQSVRVLETIVGGRR